MTQPRYPQRCGSMTALSRGGEADAGAARIRLGSTASPCDVFAMQPTGVMAFYAWIEQTPLSIWVREDLYAFFVILIFHSLGMGFLVGGGMAISLRVMGIGKGAALEKFRGFFPVMWIALGVCIVSGLLLLIGYPAKAMTNPDFAIKFTCLIAAGLLVREMARRLFPIAARGEPLPAWSRPVAAATFLIWAAAVTAGKFLPYTHHILLVSE